MAWIRTIKPEITRHELLFDLERETGFPLRFLWAAFPTACDREGRFRWRPRSLKPELLPHDELDFGRVLDLLLTRGFLVKYRHGAEWYGLIPTFHKHQAINNRERKSEIPPLDGADEVIRYDADTSTCQPRVDDETDTRDDDASTTPLGNTQGEGNGREGKGREQEGNDASSLRLDVAIRKLTELYPANRRTTGHLTEHAFLAVFERDQRDQRLVFDDLLKALEDAKRSEQWRAGRIPRLDNWLREGLYVQQHSAAAASAATSDPGARMRERTRQLLDQGQPRTAAS